MPYGKLVGPGRIIAPGLLYYCCTRAPSGAAAAMHASHRASIVTHAGVYIGPGPDLELNFRAVGRDIMYQYMQYGFDFFLAFSALCARPGAHRTIVQVRVDPGFFFLKTLRQGIAVTSPNFEW